MSVNFNILKNSIPEMYSSNSSLNGNNNNLTGTSFCSSTPFTFESNSSSSTSKHHQNTCFPPSPFSFIQFPYDTFEDNNQIFLLQEQDDHIQMNVKNKEEEEDKGKTVLVVVDEHKKNVQRKRSSKRDRHSKIKTAKGLRDRRMRLSLDVAKKFFGLQDMLGFEKASKTVEWLLNKSKLEIKQLAREKNLQNDSSSTTSECEEGVSSLDNNDHQQQQKIMLVKRSSSTNKVSRKSAFNCIGREKARERARERTRQKLNARIRDVNIVDQSNSKQCVNNNNNNNNWNPFEECAVNNSSFDVKMINHEAKEHSELEDEENSLFINMTKWSPTFMFNNSSILQQVSF